MTEPLDLIAALVLRESGIRIQPTQYAALGSAVARVAPGGDPTTFMRSAGDPIEGPRAIAKLLDEVTIKETSFFRDRAQLDAIPWRPLLARAQASGSQQIRVWCAACATGEEAYTLALLAYEAFAPAEPPVRILATDISNAALDATRAGRYRPRSLRTVAPGLLQRYFEPEGEQRLVGEKLRSVVQLAQHNLATGTMPPLGETAFDVILCRNVLIYFDGTTADHVIGGLRSALRPQGTLILGSADVLCGTARRTGVEDVRPPPAPLRRPLGVVAAACSDPIDPFAVETHFLRAISELEGGEALAATASLRHVLYLDPTFGLAAFALGRAHEATGDADAARRAYQQALRTIDLEDERHNHLIEQVDLVDVATACRARLATL